jgi:hypothetical protein
MTWLKSHPTYSLYAKNIKPGLSPENQLKQVAFSRRVMQRWGLPEQTKILWIHLDEKWFHGILPRTNAKACPELGIEKTSHSAHHKKHIAKVMGHCCVGYLFDGDVEPGGEGFLISCDRCASYKMPLRNSYISSRDNVTGKLINIQGQCNEARKRCAIPRGLCSDGNGSRNCDQIMFPVEEPLDVYAHPSYCTTSSNGRAM